MTILVQTSLHCFALYIPVPIASCSMSSAVAAAVVVPGLVTKMLGKECHSRFAVTVLHQPSRLALQAELERRAAELRAAVPRRGRLPPADLSTLQITDEGCLVLDWRRPVVVKNAYTFSSGLRI